MQSSELKIPDVYALNAKKVVIAGAGLIGLITAILLARQGMDVTVVDSWMGKCTRAHEIFKTTVKEIAAAIHPLTLVFNPKANFVQFKDIERQLFAHVKNLGVHLIEKQFHSFASKQKILLSDKNASLTAKKVALTNVDIFFDCTGEYRAGIKNYNEQSDKTTPPFQIEPINKKQQPRLFGKMRLIGDKNIFLNFYRPLTPTHFSNYFLLRKELEVLGWKEPQSPETHLKIQPKKNSSLFKSHIYMELPREYIKDKKSISESYLKSYAKLLLQLNNDTSKDIAVTLQPTKNPYKLMYSTFVVAPKKVSVPFVIKTKNRPFTAHFGDTSCSMTFHTAYGLARGILEAVNVIGFFIIKKKVIKAIKLKEWQEYYQQNLQDATTIMDKYEEKILNKKRERLMNFKQICFNAFLQANDKDARENIAKEYKKADPYLRLADIALQSVLESIDAITDPEKKMLDRYKSYLEKIETMDNPTLPEDKRNIENAWGKLAYFYHEIGIDFKALKKKNNLPQKLQAATISTAALSINYRRSL